ncbi:MAG: redoxin domain-containing protein [Acidimicrobiia bacterium]|nr:redoxin domain-containing protein [Acidimicrobiia bacterium]
MAAEIGAPAPDFTLPNTDREMVSKSDLAGNKALVVFIPFPFTGICDAEACALRDNLAALKDLDARVVVVTTHAVPTNKEWAEQNGFEFPVLSDYWPHGDVAKAYGTFNEKVGAATRSTYVLDEEGVVRDVVATDSLGTAREYDAYVEALERL